jgi:hypothetical protein
VSRRDAQGLQVQGRPSPARCIPEEGAFQGAGEAGGGVGGSLALGKGKWDGERG